MSWLRACTRVVQMENSGQHKGNTTATSSSADGESAERRVGADLRAWLELVWFIAQKP
jgi:hypothetical protein